MKRFFLSIFLFGLVSFLHAQFKTVAESMAFEEPEDGYAKLLLLKNGNTVFIHINLKEGIEVKLYDEKHREKYEKTLQTQFPSTKNKSIESVFEIDGNVLIFVNLSDDKTPMLYRLIIDGKTGNLREEKKIAQLNRVSRYTAFRLAQGGEEWPDFFVRKDPASDYYAVVNMNSAEADKNKRLEILYFGPDNKEVSRAFYISPDDRYEHMQYIDMVVIGGQKVSMLAYAYNKVKRNGRDGELVMANLNAGSTSVSLDELDFSKELVVTGGITRYNPISQNIILLAACRAEKMNQYATVVAFVDPFERIVKNAFVAYPERANGKSTELFGRKSGFTGMPQNIFVDHDGSFSIVFEEITNYSSSSGSSYSLLGHLAISRYNANGKETGCYFIPKEQLVYNTNIATFYHSSREGSAQRLVMGNQYKSFSYLHGKYKSYILFNDIEKNGESAEKGKITRIQSVGGCDGFYFLLDGDNVMPARQFVFPKAEKRSDHNLAIFSISDYDQERNTYATLELVKEGRRKEVKLVWLEPQ